jgi:3-oxoacyl-[acyl-carrier-protein] synthase II
MIIDRRVVVTGIGLVTPLGGSVAATWANILASKSGAGPITIFDPADFGTRFACEVKRGDGTGNTFDANKRVDYKVQRQVDPFIVYGIDAAGQAFEDAGLADIMTEELSYRTGVMMGAGIGGLPGIEKEAVNLFKNGPRRVSPHFVHGRIINLISGQISIKYGLRGPNHAVVTACSSGAHAIGDAARLILWGDADIMIAGGAEGAICPLGIAGFGQAKALSTRNDDPQGASRPYDKGRDGFVMGEGAGAVVLEEYEHAKKRGAKIYAEIIGYGMSGDAYHVTAPAEDGNGGYRSMEMALKRAQMSPSDIDYINAHGTSTPLGDEIELGAVRRLFGSAMDTVSMSSTKSAIGHLLGGAGAVESIFCILAMRDQIAPPTINLSDPSDSCAGVDLVPNVAKPRIIKAVLNNSFGFGGTNATVIMKAVD